MQGRTCKRYRNKVGMKAPYPATEHGEKERQHYIHCKNVSCNGCSVVFLVFLFRHVRQWGSLGCFLFHIVSVLFTGPSLHDINFHKKNVLPLLQYDCYGSIRTIYPCFINPYICTLLNLNITELERNLTSTHT